MKTKLVFALAFISIVGFQAHAMEKKDVTEAKFYVESQKHRLLSGPYKGQARYPNVVIKAVLETGKNGEKLLRILEPENFGFKTVPECFFVESRSNPSK